MFQMKIKFTVTLLIVLLLLPVIPSDVSADKSAGKVQDEVIYNILVDRLNNGNPKLNEQIDITDPLTYSGGDILGIMMKLDDLAKHGFTTIALSPIMENVDRGYHGYWIDDFLQVEEQFGTLASLENLIEQAHQRDIKVILELPLNYVAKTSSLVSEVGKEDWFKEVTVEPTEATNWLTEVYALDQEREDVQAYLLEVAKYWMTELDIDGYSLHAADQLAPAFLDEVTKQIKTDNPDFYILARTLHPNTDTNYLYDYDIDAIENWEIFDLMNKTLSNVGEPISALHEAWSEVGSDRDLLFLDNENMARFSNNLFAGERNTVTGWKVALAYLYMIPGVPMVYQGSEIPMFGTEFPENQKTVDFGTADPDMETLFYQISALRQNYTAFVDGDFEEIAVDQGMSLFKRTTENQTIYVAINNDPESRMVTLTDAEVAEGKQLRGMLYDDTVRMNKDGEFRLGITRESAEVYVLQDNTGFNWKIIGFAAGVFTIFGVGIYILSRKQKKRERAEQVKVK